MLPTSMSGAFKLPIARENSFNLAPLFCRRPQNSQTPDYYWLSMLLLYDGFNTFSHSKGFLSDYKIEIEYHFGNLSLAFLPSTLTVRK